MDKKHKARYNERKKNDGVDNDSLLLCTCRHSIGRVLLLSSTLEEKHKIPSPWMSRDITGVRSPPYGTCMIYVHS